MRRMNWIAFVASYLLIIPLAAVPTLAQYSYDYNSSYYNPGSMSNTGTGTAIGGIPGLPSSTGVGSPLGNIGIGTGTSPLVPGSQVGNPLTSPYIGGGLGLPSTGIGGGFPSSGLGTTIPGSIFGY